MLMINFAGVISTYNATNFMLVIIFPGVLSCSSNLLD